MSLLFAVRFWFAGMKLLDVLYDDRHIEARKKKALNP
jgi:hypothetical protein